MKSKINSKIAYIFDMDGTIVDLEALNHNSINETIDKFFQYKLSNDQYQKYFSGLKATESFANFIKFYNPQTNITKQELIDEFRRIKRYCLLNRFNDSVTLIKGAKEYLIKLKNENKKIVLATSAIKEFTLIILRNYDILDIFDKIITAEDVIKGKPDPEIYLKALNFTGVTASQAVVFEDSKSGIMSAKNAGITCIGIHTKGLNDDYVQTADYVIQNYYELL